MTPQPHPYGPQDPEQSPPSQLPDSSASDSDAFGAGDPRADQVTRTPYAPSRFPASTTALSQADGEA
jgi:hypothetical protein